MKYSDFLARKADHGTREGFDPAFLPGFLDHYGFVVREIHRLTMPGRLTAVHCATVPIGNTGRGDALIDLPGDITRLHQEVGFDLVGEYHVWKEPLAVRNRTMAKKLAHKMIVDDAARCGNAAADQLLAFRKRGDNPVPVEHPTGLLDYAGERKIPAEVLRYRGWTGNQIENRYSHWIWRQYASAFWDDVRIDRVLPYREARDPEDEKHVHPLQLDVIERAVTLGRRWNRSALLRMGRHRGRRLLGRRRGVQPRMG